MDSGDNINPSGWLYLDIGFIDSLLARVIVLRREKGPTMADRPLRSNARKSAALVILVLSVLLAFGNGMPAWALEQVPVAQIAIVQAPSTVLPNEGFVVTVTVDYSGSYSTDIAILDKATGFVLASKGLIIPAGQDVFHFQLTSPESSGVWMLLATVRIWWHDGWFANEKGSTFPFEITISNQSQTNFTLALESNDTPLVVTIDSVPHSLPAGGIQLSTTRGFHTIEIEPSLSKSNGTRAMFDHWSDGIGSFSRKIYLTGNLDLSATYLTEYLLTVKSSIGETVGSGWYPEGTNAMFAVTNSGFVGNSSTGLASYKFSHWSGDSDSNSPAGWLVMDGPKTVVANWSEDNSQTTVASEIMIASLVFLACSAMLVAIGILLRRKTTVQKRSHLFRAGAYARAIFMVLLSLVAIANPSMVQPARAFVPIRPESVTIGDATWFHWNQAASDTLVIWLGGGIVDHTSYLINPYEFESYNTILFIQDLAKYYDVLALEKGSIRTVDPLLNRTIFREPYPGSYNFMKKIRSWATEQGYMYLYVVGYSVGAMVAANELIDVSPEDWASPNGFIIITTKIDEEVSSKASALRASVLLLYGDRIAPEFTKSGQAFFRNTPEEGWRDGSWYHREYHVIPDVEHEVWTILDSGEYDGRATLLTINFIETCKSLQFEGAKDPISRIALNDTGIIGILSPYSATIISVHSPRKIGTREAFKVSVEVRYDLPLNSTRALVAFDTDAASIVSAAEEHPMGYHEAHLNMTILSGENARTMHLTLIPLIQVGGNWSVVTDGARGISVDVTDSFSTHIIVGYSNAIVELDGQAFRTGENGEITMYATPGEHSISTSPIIMIGDTTRAVFQQWNVTSTSSTLNLSISRDVCLLAIYRRQYYLNVTSPLGQVSGAGWYDEDSVAVFRVTPPMMTNNGTHAFVGWLGDSNDSSPSSSVIMNRSKNIDASWKAVTPGRESTSILQLQVPIIMSLAVLVACVIFVVMSFHHRRSSSMAGAPLR
jgi:hypothetical protein